jgi:hypothetical protein
MTLADRDWHPGGIPDEAYAPPDKDGIRWLHLGNGPKAEGATDWAGAALLIAASLLLLGLAATQGFVSWHQQFVFVLASKHDRTVSGLEALGLDAAAVIFAVLAVAQARLGRSAHIERALNLACALGSMTMNVLGADLLSPRSIAVYVLPPVLYAAGSDRLIAVVRQHALSRLGDQADQRSVWHVAGAAAMWLLRLMVAPPSTLGGFRTWVVDSCPTAPGESVAALRALDAQAKAEQLAITAGEASEDARAARDDAESAQAELRTRTAEHEAALAKVRAEAERAVESAQAQARGEVAAATAERDQATADASASTSAAEAATAEAGRLRVEAERAAAQARAATQERDQVRTQAGTTAQQAALARQAAEMAQADLARERAAADQQVAQVRADAERGRAELAAAFQSRPAPQAGSRSRTRQPSDGTVPREGSKRAQLIKAYEALNGKDPRYGDRSAVSPVAHELAETVGLEWGSARTYLYRHLDGQASA